MRTVDMCTPLCVKWRSFSRSFSSRSSHACLAEDKVKAWRSFDSVGWRMLKECTEGLKGQHLVDLGPDYEIAAGEIDEIVQALDKVGASVYLADENISLSACEVSMTCVATACFSTSLHWSPTKMIQVIRHEGHAAQDCMAGTLNNTFTALTIQKRLYRIDSTWRWAYLPKKVLPLKLKQCGRCMSRTRPSKHWKFVEVPRKCGTLHAHAFDRRMVEKRVSCESKVRSTGLK